VAPEFKKKSFLGNARVFIGTWEPSSGGDVYLDVKRNPNAASTVAKPPRNS